MLVWCCDASSTNPTLNWHKLNRRSCCSPSVHHTAAPGAQCRLQRILGLYCLLEENIVIFVWKVQIDLRQRWTLNFERREKDPRFAGHSPDSRTAINHQIHKLVPTLIFGNIHIGNGNFLLPWEQISTAGCRVAAITLKHYIESKQRCVRRE